MQICQTDQGLARLEEHDGAPVLAILDVAQSNLHEVLAQSSVAALTDAPAKQLVPPAEATLKTLLPHAGRFVIAGMNYHAHCEEIGHSVPDRLIFGNAPGSATHSARADILIPPNHPDEVDYEGEIGVVISRSAEQISAEDAWSVVAGLLPLNDVSARDVQAAGTLEAVGKAKGFPGFKPHGPYLATLDEFPNPLDIGLTTHVNGELRQSGRSSDMIFPIPEIIARVTARIPLQAGDVICTGTPGGVAHGGKFPYLRPGDTVEIRLEGKPGLRNTFVA
ncbi:MAG: fumarylacetoacetate hydrolase family protein [Pseudomonadota bacterium]